MPLPTTGEIKAVLETAQAGFHMVAPELTAKLVTELTTIYGKGEGLLVEATESATTSFSTALVKGGFTLPRHVIPRFVERTPPPFTKTRALPQPLHPDYDRIAAHRLNVRLDLAEENTIGIMHPRFRNGAKQMAMLKSRDRNLSLYGNNESGIGVLEYEALPSRRPYFKHADSVVQIRGHGDKVSTGSGTIISEDGLIATAAHVLHPGQSFTIDTIKGRFEAAIVARRLDEHADHAALQLLEVPKDISFPVPPLTSSGLKDGMRAAAVGHAQGMSRKFASIGRYLQEGEFGVSNFHGTYPTFALDSIVPGYSGGPIFDADGNFAVILTSIFTQGDGIPKYANMNRATITGNRIEDLLTTLREQKIVSPSRLHMSTSP